MSRRTTKLFAVTAAAVPVLGVNLAPNAGAIVGGTTATNASVVHLVNDTSLCSANVISSRWVLTARHCVEDTRAIDIITGSSTTRPGPTVHADRWYAAPHRDFALIHLAKPVRIPAARLGAYTPKVGSHGTIYGFGMLAGDVSSMHLRKANVNVIGRSFDAYGGPAIHIRGVNGIDNHGDSGGPLIVNGRVVGVDSAGDTDPVVSRTASSSCASVGAAAQWIKRISGVSVR